MTLAIHSKIDEQDIPGRIGVLETALNNQADFTDTGTQTIAGDKTFSGAVNVSGAFKAAGVNNLRAAERSFTETAGAGVYTGSVILPAGTIIHDIIVSGVALWNASTTAIMKVGIDSVDDDGFYTAVDLRATDLLADESLSFANAGGKAGALIHTSQVDKRYTAAGMTVSGIITTTGTGGTAGRTRMTVLYTTVTSGDIVAATKV